MLKFLVVSLSFQLHKFKLQLRAMADSTNELSMKTAIVSIHSSCLKTTVISDIFVHLIIIVQSLEYHWFLKILPRSSVCNEDLLFHLNPHNTLENVLTKT